MARGVAKSFGSKMFATRTKRVWASRIPVVGACPWPGCPPAPPPYRFLKKNPTMLKTRNGSEADAIFFEDLPGIFFGLESGYYETEELIRS